MFATVVVPHQSTLGVGESLFVAVVGGLIVVLIPFILKYFNGKFTAINDATEIAQKAAKEAAEATARVDKHHSENKRRFKKITDKQDIVIQRLDDITHALEESNVSSHGT